MRPRRRRRRAAHGASTRRQHVLVGAAARGAARLVARAPLLCLLPRAVAIARLAVLGSHVARIPVGGLQALRRLALALRRLRLRVASAGGAGGGRGGRQLGAEVARRGLVLVDGPRRHRRRADAHGAHVLCEHEGPLEPKEARSLASHGDSADTAGTQTPAVLTSGTKQAQLSIVLGQTPYNKAPASISAVS